MKINDLCIESYERAVRKGFYDNGGPSVCERLMLIVSECAEALECNRDDQMETYLSTVKPGKPEGFPSELADIVIRVCDLAASLRIDLEKEIRLKSDYNETRPHKHGRVRL
jgi:NTP pyrophosphatase (non-canonical NTP hydrolase)